jgi:outer membrane protein TolC
MRSGISSGAALGALGLGWAIVLSTTLAWGQSRPEAGDAAATRVTLHEAVDRALAKNPTYANAMLEVRRAGAVVRETKAAWLPTLYSYDSVTHLDGNRVEGQSMLLAQNELAANVTLTVPLVMTRQWLTTAESRMTADATKATSADVRRLVAYSTGQAYLAVYSQKLVIEVDERARDTARSHAAYAHQRYAGGVGNSIDEVRAVQEAATDDALVQQAYALLTADDEALGILTGDQGPLDTADEPTLPEPPSLPEGLAGAARRPDVVALDLRSQAARRTRRTWSASRSPSTRTPRRRRSLAPASRSSSSSPSRFTTAAFGTVSTANARPCATKRA